MAAFREADYQDFNISIYIYFIRFYDNTEQRRSYRWRMPFLCAGLCRERTGLVVMIKENGYGEEELYEG